ncbi:MAG: hypothetical protein V9H26_26705 [Verrucomicrobiota bacterium]
MKARLDARGIDVDLERCVARQKADGRLLLGDPQAVEPWRDPEVWQMIASGHGRAVHHIESPAMTSLCRMCNVNEIDGLVAIVSVIRPGAANEGKKDVVHSSVSRNGADRVSASLLGTVSAEHLRIGGV